jgi:tetratricopeptide (TPR) repeat protein
VNTESAGADDSKPRRTERAQVLAAAVLALPVILALYANALNGPFQFDDRHAIVENPALRATIDSTWWGASAWTVGAGHYRPLTFITYAMNIRWSGLDPFSFHLFNVFLHWAATATLMGTLWVVLRRAVPAIAAGLLFAVTPANSEAVNYVAARSSLLVGLWGALAIASFVLFRRAQAADRRTTSLLAGLGAVAALGMGLASKETAAIVPMVWLCYDLGWSRALPRKPLLLPYVVVAGLGAGYFAASGYHRTLWAVLSGTQSGDRDVWVNLWSQLAAFPLHVTTFVWPFSLTVLRDVPVLDSPWRTAVVVGVALAAAVAAVSVYWLTRATDARRPAGFLLLWWMASLLPATVYPLHVLFQEHRDYLAWMGLAGATGLVADAVWNRFAGRARWALAGGGVVVLAVLSAATIARGHVWADELAFWTDAVAKAPRHAVARVNLGNEYFRQGDGARALAEYQQAIRFQPDYGLAHYNIGVFHLGRGEYADARTALERAVALTPDGAEPLAALSGVYRALGDAERERESLDRAAAALERRPHAPAARVVVADALAKGARWEEAIAQYRAVLAEERERPSILSAKSYLGLGYIAERLGRPEDALDAYTHALEVDPELNDALFNSANVLLAARRYAEATVAYERLLVNAPSFFQARFNLARLYERDGKLSDAEREYRAFLRDAPAGPGYDTAREFAASRLGSKGLAEGPPGKASR